MIYYQLLSYIISSEFMIRLENGYNCTLYLLFTTTSRNELERSATSHLHYYFQFYLSLAKKNFYICMSTRFWLCKPTELILDLYFGVGALKRLNVKTFSFTLAVYTRTRIELFFI